MVGAGDSAKHCRGNMNQPSQNNFDAIIVAEIKNLRSGERRLERLYSDLHAKPQLRGHFLRELAALQLRADRLEAVLNPVGALSASPAYLAQA
jgi:hypothetical protein